MIEGIAASLLAMVAPINIFYLALGTVIGLFFGAVPGIGGTVTLALLLPFTFSMSVESSLVLLMGTSAGISQGGAVSSILLGIPGNSGSVASVFDGYELAKQGRAGEALGASAMASAMGSTLGLFLFAIILPVAIPVVLAFGPPEFFAIALGGLILIATVSEGSMIKGLIAGAVGVLLATVGYDPVTGSIRLAFGSDYLYDGIDFISIIIGLFAIGEMIALVVKKTEVSRIPPLTDLSGLWRGAKEVLGPRGRLVFLQSSIVGWFVGVVPGLGSTVGSFLAYVQAKALFKDGNFGHGDIRGVIAPGAANDAKEGGSLLPTLGLGLPGSAEGAVLMTALILHGIQPGLTMLIQHQDLVWLIVLILVVGNILSSIVVSLASVQLIKVTSIPMGILVPIVVVTSIAASFFIRGELLDVTVTMIFGVIGYWMIRLGYSRATLIIAFVLAPIAEKAFFQSLQISGGDYSILIWRPIPICLLIAIILLVGYKLMPRRVPQKITS